MEEGGVVEFGEPLGEVGGEDAGAAADFAEEGVGGERWELVF
jgi:hypothetical protein